MVIYHQLIIFSLLTVQIQLKFIVIENQIMLCTFITSNNDKPDCTGNLTVITQILLRIIAEVSSCGL